MDKLGNFYEMLPRLCISIQYIIILNVVRMAKNNLTNRSNEKNIRGLKLEGIFVFVFPLLLSWLVWDHYLWQSQILRTCRIRWSLNLVPDSCCRHKFALFDGKHCILQIEISFCSPFWNMKMFSENLVPLIIVYAVDASKYL